MGEYNANFGFSKRQKNRNFTDKKGSQINNNEPSKYEFEALKFLEPLGITPKVLSYIIKVHFYHMVDLQWSLEGKGIT